MDVVIGWIINAFKGLIGLIPLLRKPSEPDLFLEVVEATPDPHLFGDLQNSDQE